MFLSRVFFGARIIMTNQSTELDSSPQTIPLS
jgi:hypothetical protein